MDKHISNRMIEIRTQLHLNQKQFAFILNLKPTQLSAIELGKLNVTIPIMLILYKNYNVNLNWLITGDESMFVISSDNINAKTIISWLEKIDKEGYKPK